MAIRNYKEFVEAAHQSGKTHWQNFAYLSNFTRQFRWSSTFAVQTTSGSISHLPRSYSGVPGAFAPVTGGTFRDVYTGPNPASGEQKLLTSMTLMNAFNSSYSDVLFPVDILGYYPQVDASVVGQTNLTNTLSLPDYTSGDGVYAFIAGTVGVTSTAVSCSITYTNQDGVGNRVSNFFIQSSGNSDEIVAGSFLNQSGVYGVGSVTSGPLLPLQSGDRGIRSIQSITTGASCQSFVNIVLCRPLVAAPLNVTSVGARQGLVQFDFLSSSGFPIQIRNNSCLHMLTTSNNPFSTSQLMLSRGLFEFVWG